MQGKKCLATLGVLRRRVVGYGRWGVVLTIVMVALTLASNAASSQPGGEPDAAGAYNILHLFTVAKFPSGNLIFDAAGNLYGTTIIGGRSASSCSSNSCGVVWKLARNPKGTWTVSILHFFTGPDGAIPARGWSSTRPAISTARRPTAGLTEMASCSSWRPTPVGLGRRACSTASPVARTEA